jgi:hypothetical protein
MTLRTTVLSITIQILTFSIAIKMKLSAQLLSVAIKMRHTEQH